MKKFYLILISCLIFIGSGNCQPYPYEISSSIQPFTNLANPVSLNNGNVWTPDSIYTVQLTNFDFKVNGIPITYIDAMAARGLLFNGTFDQWIFGYSTVYGGSNGSLLIDKGSTISLSPINYEFSGPPGSQILKFEWLNGGFNPFWCTDTSSFASYQIWLFESDDHLELHYGPNDSTTVNVPAGGPFISFKCYGDTGVYIAHNQNNPYLYWTYFNQPNYSPLFGLPDDGRVFTITKNPLFSGLDSPNEVSSITIYPNPSANKFQIKSDNFRDGTCTIFNTNGKELFQQQVYSNLTFIDMDDYPKGVYFIRIVAEDFAGYQKLIKQ